MKLSPQLSSSSLSSERMSDVTHCTNVKARRLVCFKNLLVETHFRVKIDAKIFGWWLKLERWTGNWNWCNGFSQGFEGLWPYWVAKSNVFILGYIEIKIIVKAPVVDWLCRAQDSWCASLEEFAPTYSWVSSAYWWKDTKFFVFDKPWFISLAIGGMKKRREVGQAR